MDNSEIMCDEVTESYDEETKTIPTNFNEKKATCKMQNLYIILLVFLLFALIAVSIYCHLIKYQVKQKHSLSFHDKNNELREVLH